VKLLIYKNTATGEWRWTLRASNGRIIGASSEGYRQRGKMLDNVYMVTRIRLSAVVYRIRFKQLELDVRTSPSESDLLRIAV
jgi:uncharacterized protein YegP (UPF0339 family)